MQKSKETFWAVSKEYEKYLRTAAQESTNSKKKASGRLAFFVKYENSW